VWERELEGREWDVDGFNVSVGGKQRADGTVRYWLDIECSNQLTPAQAAEVAAAMTEAATEVTRLSELHPPFM